MESTKENNDKLQDSNHLLPQTNIIQQSQPNQSLMATPELVLEWRKQFIKEGHTLPSVESYYSFIKRYVDYGIEINQKTVNRYRSSHMSGVASGALKNFFKFLVEKKEFPEEILNIRFGKSKTIQKFPESISPVEVDRIIKAMPSVRDRDLTIVIFGLGLRISEALKLLWSDFDWVDWVSNKNEWGKVNLKHTKRGKFRTIPVPPEIMERLYEDHLARTTEGVPIGNLVFDIGIDKYLMGEEGKPKKLSKEEEDKVKYNYIVYAENYYRELLYKISKEVIGRRINPHRLRHSKAQDLMNRGVPIETIKAFLGHASISSTEVYAQASSEKIESDLKKIHRVEGEQK